MRIRDQLVSGLRHPAGSHWRRGIKRTRSPEDQFEPPATPYPAFLVLLPAPPITSIPTVKSEVDDVQIPRTPALALGGTSTTISDAALVSTGRNPPAITPPDVIRLLPASSPTPSSPIKSRGRSMHSTKWSARSLELRGDKASSRDLSSASATFSGKGHSMVSDSAKGSSTPRKLPRLREPSFGRKEWTRDFDSLPISSSAPSSPIDILAPTTLTFLSSALQGASSSRRAVSIPLVPTTPGGSSSPAYTKVGDILQPTTQAHPSPSLGSTTTTFTNPVSAPNIAFEADFLGSSPAVSGIRTRRRQPPRVVPVAPGWAGKTRASAKSASSSKLVNQVHVLETRTRSGRM
jgi:hypothetical protein